MPAGPSVRSGPRPRAPNFSCRNSPCATSAWASARLAASKILSIVDAEQLELVDQHHQRGLVAVDRAGVGPLARQSQVAADRLGQVVGGGRDDGVGRRGCPARAGAAGAGSSWMVRAIRTHPRESPTGGALPSAQHRARPGPARPGCPASVGAAGTGGPLGSVGAAQPLPATTSAPPRSPSPFSVSGSRRQVECARRVAGVVLRAPGRGRTRGLLDLGLEHADRRRHRSSALTLNSSIESIVA